MNVIAYHEDLGGEQFSANVELVRRWHDNWSQWGWSPLCFGRRAFNESRWGSWLNDMLQLPTSNPPEYQAAVWRRWCVWADAAHEICAKGPAFIADYDTFNWKVTPDLVGVAENQTLDFSGDGTVWALRVNAKALKLMPHIMRAVAPLKIHYENGHEHTSDMWVLESLRNGGLVCVGHPLGIHFRFTMKAGFMFHNQPPCLVHLANSLVAEHGMTSLEAWKKVEVL